MALKPVYRRLAYALLGVAVFLVVLPELIRFGARYALTELSAQSAEIEDIDLNLFTGRIGVTGVRIDYNDKTTLSLGSLQIDLDMAALFSKQLLLEQVSLADVNVVVDEQDGQWVAVLPIPAADGEAAVNDEPSQAPEQNPWKVGINNLALDNVAVFATFQGQKHQLSLEQLVAADLVMWEPDKPASLKLKGVFNDAPLDFDSGLTPFAEPRRFSLAISLQGLDLAPINQFLPDTIQQVGATLSVDTRVSLQLHADGGLGLEQDGVISLSPTSVSAMGVHAEAADIRWQGQVAVEFPKEAAAKVTATGEVSVTELGVAYEALEANAAWQDLRWQGEVRVDLPAAAQPVLALQGALTLKDLRADQATLKLSQGLAGLSWQGDIRTDLAAPEASLAIKGDLELEQWWLDDAVGFGRMAQFAGLGLKNIALQGVDEIAVNGVNLDGVYLLARAGGDKALASLGGLAMAEVAVKDRHQLVINAVGLRDLQAQVTRGADGKLVSVDDWVADVQQRVDGFLRQLQERAEANRPTVEPASAETETAPAEAVAEGSVAEDSAGASEQESVPALVFAVNEVSVSGNNRVVFHDEGVQPAVTHPIVIKAVNLGKLDSSNISIMTQVRVEAALYEYGVLNLFGEATLLQSLEAMQADIRASIKGVELPELSPYLENATGYHAASGQLNITSKAKIEAGQLDSETKVKVLRIDLDPMDQAVIDKLSKKISMPIETALTVITDSDDTLAVTVPVKGDLSNPDIDLGRIVGGAVAQAVQNAALTYFKYAVQPFGAILLVSEKIGDMTMQAKFGEPARFVPGTANVVPEQQGYMEKVAGMIKEKEGFSILVCVMVTEKDFMARENAVALPEGQTYQWDEASEALAKARLGTIKNSLINDYGLSPDRVQSCRPQITSGEPRAVMGM